MRISAGNFQTSSAVASIQSANLSVCLALCVWFTTHTPIKRVIYTHCTYTKGRMEVSHKNLFATKCICTQRHIAKRKGWYEYCIEEWCALVGSITVCEARSSSSGNDSFASCCLFICWPLVARQTGRQREVRWCNANTSFVPLSSSASLFFSSSYSTTITFLPQSHYSSSISLWSILIWFGSVIDVNYLMPWWRCAACSLQSPFEFSKPTSGLETSDMWIGNGFYS